MRNGNKLWTLISLAINPVSVLHPLQPTSGQRRNAPDQWFLESSSEQQRQCPTSGLKTTGSRTLHHSSAYWVRSSGATFQEAQILRTSNRVSVFVAETLKKSL